MNKLTDDYIESLIQVEQYHIIEGTTVTVCALVTKSGFVAIGHSGCADKTLFDEAKGQQFARTHAMDMLWQCEGYKLHETLNNKQENQ